MMLSKLAKLSPKIQIRCKKRVREALNLVLLLLMIYLFFIVYCVIMKYNVSYLAFRLTLLNLLSYDPLYIMYLDVMETLEKNYYRFRMLLYILTIVELSRKLDLGFSAIYTYS